VKILLQNILYFIGLFYLFSFLFFLLLLKCKSGHAWHFQQAECAAMRGPEPGAGSAHSALVFALLFAGLCRSVGCGSVSEAGGAASLFFFCSVQWVWIHAHSSSLPSSCPLSSQATSSTTFAARLLSAQYLRCRLESSSRGCPRGDDAFTKKKREIKERK
jgi:hypothetical protein